MSKIRKITGQAQNIAYQVNKVIEQLEAIINQKLAKDGSEPMTGNLDMNKHTINNLGYLDLRKTKVFIDDGESFEEPVSYRQLNNLHRMLTGKSLPEIPEEGSGSGVNADKLDGEDSFYYLDPRNFPFENYILGFKATNFRDAIIELYFKVMKHLEDDKFPRLSGNLDTNGHSILYTEVLNTSNNKTTYIDWNNSNVQRLLLTKDTKVIFYPPLKQAHLTLIIQQDEYGNHSVTLPPMKTVMGGKIQLSTEANSEDILFLYFDGSNYIANPLANLKLTEEPIYMPSIEAEEGKSVSPIEVKFPFRDRWVYEFRNKTHLNTEDNNGSRFNFERKPFTIEMWINPSKTTGTGTLVSKISDPEVAGARTGYELEIYNGALKFIMETDSEQESRATTSMIEEHKWQHIAVARENNNLRFYINGKLTDNYKDVQNLNVNSKWSLNIGVSTTEGGEEHDDARYNSYKGLMCEVAFWDRALTEEDLSSRLTEELKGNEKDLFAYYKLNNDYEGDENKIDNLNSGNISRYKIDEEGNMVAVTAEEDDEDIETTGEDIEPTNIEAVKDVFVKNYVDDNEDTKMAVRRPGEWVYIDVFEDNNAS